MGVVAAGCLLVLGFAAVSIPAVTWSEWFFGNRFTFCGAEFDGSTVVFVVDRSGSSLSSLSAAKKEIAALVRRSAMHFELGVVFSDRVIVRFPTSTGTVRATRKSKGELHAFVTGMPQGGASCIKDGLLEAIGMVNESTARKKLIIYVGDGGGTCSGDEVSYLKETLSEVARANDRGAIIHCVCADAGRLGRSFLEELAQMTGGKVIDLPRG